MNYDDNTWSSSDHGTLVTCYVKHCIATVHQIVTHNDMSLGLHYARTLRWPIAATLIALLLAVAVVKAARS